MDVGTGAALLLDLPLELIYKVLACVPLASYGAVVLTCKTLCDLLTSRLSPLRYSRLIDGSHPRLVPSWSILNVLSMRIETTEFKEPGHFRPVTVVTETTRGWESDPDAIEVETKFYGIGEARTPTTRKETWRNAGSHRFGDDAYERSAATSRGLFSKGIGSGGTVSEKHVLNDYELQTRNGVDVFWTYTLSKAFRVELWVDESEFWNEECRETRLVIHGYTDRSYRDPTACVSFWTPREGCGVFLDEIDDDCVSLPCVETCSANESVTRYGRLLRDTNVFLTLAYRRRSDASSYDDAYDSGLTEFRGELYLGRAAAEDPCGQPFASLTLIPEKNLMEIECADGDPDPVTGRYGTRTYSFPIEGT